MAGISGIHTLERMAKFDDDGYITADSGLAICDEIREIARPFIKNINKKNLSFFIAVVDGEKDFTVTIHGEDAIVPGTMPPVENAKGVFTAKGGARPRQNDSEFKFLEPFGEKHDKDSSSGTIYGFSEQMPCPVSCKDVIENQFPSVFGNRFDLHVTAVYQSEAERHAAVDKRVEQWNSHQSKHTDLEEGGTRQ